MTWSSSTRRTSCRTRRSRRCCRRWPRGRRPGIRRCGTRARRSTSGIHEHGVAFSRVRERGIKGDDRARVLRVVAGRDNPEDVPEPLRKTSSARAGESRPRYSHLARDRRHGAQGAIRSQLRGRAPRCGRLARPRRHRRRDPTRDGSRRRRSRLRGRGPHRSRARHVPRPRIYHGRVCGSPHGWTRPHRGRQARPRHRVGLDYIAGVVSRQSPAAVVVDGKGPDASLIEALEREEIEVTVLNGAEYAQACGGFFDAFTRARRGGRTSSDRAPPGNR